MFNSMVFDRVPVRESSMFVVVVTIGEKRGRAVYDRESSVGRPASLAFVGRRGPRCHVTEGAGLHCERELWCGTSPREW
jgi:hypothetical protein